MSGDQTPSRYLRMDRAVVTKQLIQRTGQNPSHTNDGAVTNGFTVQTYGQRVVLIRWIGPVEDETKNLNRYEQALQRQGYVVTRMTEDNLETRTAAQREQQKKRRNRQLLYAQKLKPEFANRNSKRRRGVHVR